LRLRATHRIYRAVGIFSNVWQNIQNPAALFLVFNSMPEQTAHIPISYLCRFGELTKREIQILVILFASRNGKTGRCDPSRALIGRLTRIDRGNTGRAVAGLIGKGWISEDQETGQFEINAAEAIRAGNVAKIATPNVAKSATPDEEACCQIGNSMLPNWQPNVAKLAKHVIIYEQKRTEKEQKKINVEADILRVFEYWRHEMSYTDRMTLTPGRKAKIKSRLKKYSASDLRLAIDGCKRSAFHQGDNDAGKKYNDIEFICRNETKVETFIELARNRARIVPAEARNGRWQDVGKTIESDPGPAELTYEIEDVEPFDLEEFERNAAAERQRKADEKARADDARFRRKYRIARRAN
jgi:hypothetical protein